MTKTAGLRAPADLGHILTAIERVALYTDRIDEAEFVNSWAPCRSRTRFCVISRSFARLLAMSNAWRPTWCESIRTYRGPC